MSRDIIQKGDWRSELLTRLAKGKDCQMESPGCNHDRATVVWCHSDMQVHGKGMGIKAIDWFGFFGCSGCNYWYDEGPGSRESKERHFWIAHSRTVILLLIGGHVAIIENPPDLDKIPF